MRRNLLILTLVFVMGMATVYYARATVVCTPLGTLTANLSLCKPITGELSWAAAIDNNFDVLDAKFPSGNLAGSLTTGSVLTMNPLAVGASAVAIHGLGQQPSFVISVLQNVVADCGFSIGDQVRIEGTMDATTSANVYGGTIATDATNIFLTTGNGTITVPNKTTANNCTITTANWKWVATPFRVN